MNTKTLIAGIMTSLLFTGCIVLSFHPLYQKEDLFANDLLIGTWIDEDSTAWKFDFHCFPGDSVAENRDSTSFILHLQEPGASCFAEACFRIHIIRLAGHYFLDFYLENYFDNNIDLFDMHLIPVHSFARLELSGDEAIIRWFDPEWIDDLFQKKRKQIAHENNGENTLLTASTEELQQFVAKYANEEAAFKDGLTLRLHRVP